MYKNNTTAPNISVIVVCIVMFISIYIDFCNIKNILFQSQSARHGYHNQYRLEQA